MVFGILECLIQMEIKKLRVLGYFLFSLISYKIGDHSHDIVHVLSCYDPTTREEKDKFYDLQCTFRNSIDVYYNG